MVPWAAFADMVEFTLSDPSSRAVPTPKLMQKSDRGKSSAHPRGPGHPGMRPPAVELGDLDMRIARDGAWFYRGSPINRIALVKLFASVLRREKDGTYWLVTPAERGRVTVEDAPFIAVAVEREREGREQRLIFRTNLDEIVAAGADHRLRVETAADGAPAPYILVRPGLGARPGLEARLARPVFYELVEWGEEQPIAGEVQFGVWSGGVFFRLGELDEET
jgi:uncharacterized protein